MTKTLESCSFFIGGEWLQPKVTATPIEAPIAETGKSLNLKA